MLDRLGLADAETIEIAVFGLACRHCEATVEAVLEDLSAVDRADADREGGRARVRGTGDVSAQALVAQVRSVGYEARPLSKGG
jgi:copper chaperone CopZ